ncbi:MAG: thioredoxin family protein [Anaerovoracaceae bacterium]|jgi:small redox-active disulfide protein 2
MGLFSRKKKTEKEENTSLNAAPENDAPAADAAADQSGPALTIKVLGSRCKNCRALLKNTEDAVSAMKVNADVEYFTDMKEVAKYGVMSTPALVAGEKVVSAGKVLSPSDIQKLLEKTGPA